MKKGWEIKKLKEIGETQTGNTPSTTDKENYGNFIPFVKPAHFRADGTIDFEESGLSEKGVKSARIFKANSILMVCIGATIGKTGFSEIAVTSNQQINALTPREEFEPRFFYYQFISNSFFRKIIYNSSQATLPIIIKSKWENLTVVVPRNKNEQQQIVSILDEAFAAINHAKENLQRNLQNAKELFESELNSIFTKKGEGWVERSIEDVANVVNGFSFKSTDFSPLNRIKSVKITNVGVKEFIEDIDNYLPERFVNDYSGYLVHEGNIAIALTRTIISSGLKVAIVPKSYNKALINQRVAALIPNDKIINQRFLYNFLCTNEFANYVKANVNTLMQPNLSIYDLKKLPIHCPSLKEQQKIVKQLDALSFQTKQLEANYQNQINNLEALKKSVLQKAFSGELTNKAVTV